MTTKYAREEISYDIDMLDILVAQGMAKMFVTTKGPIYVVKQIDGSSVKVTGEQIVRAYSDQLMAWEQEQIDAANMLPIGIDEDNAAEAMLADAEAFLRDRDVELAPVASPEMEAAAARQGVSISEYTDGEYVSRKARRVEIASFLNDFIG
jgi:hypothetical protein